MTDRGYNPLNEIFLKTPEGQLTEELENINNIKLFFEFLIDDSISSDEKESVLIDITSKIHTNRYISEFFSSYNDKSIYIYLFDLFSKENQSQKLKEAIIFFITELLLNIDAGKDIYEYLFQKLSKIYRGEIQPKPENLYTYLKLLHIISAEIEPKTPKSYISCSGHGFFNVDLSKNPKNTLTVGYGFSINLNFKISNYYPNQKNPNRNRKASLAQVFFSDGKSFSIDLQYPIFLIVKEIRNECIKTLPLDEWINLIITIVRLKNGIQFYFYVNGENHVSPFKIDRFPLKPDTTINYIVFFNNFYGEVSSIYMFSQSETGNPGANNSLFLSQLKNYSEGLWKKTKIDNFMKMLKTYDSIYKEGSATKTVNANVNVKSNNEKVEKKKTLFDNMVFLFSPMNTYSKKPNLVEDIFGKFQMKYKGNILVHRYQSYQKKLVLVGGFSNFYPIAEMFLIYPDILTEQNFELFLKIIGSTLNFRKQNLKVVNKMKLFKILSMFMEKYPNKVYTENILNALFSLGKTLFINNLESECSNYFNYILLNEKILSKFNENLQSTFWKKLYLFCQSDITQVEIFLNINRLCLILRFYDRNKYKEMCCEEHLNMIKEQYRGSLKVMNPTINTKLSQLKDIMNLIIDSAQSNSALAFFKLLTLDLSPCLIKFILNIFIKAFDKTKTNDEWKETFIEQLIESRYEVIIFNTFIHALPDVRIELLIFLFQIHKKLVVFKKFDNITVLEQMIKTCLLPEKMFYNKKIFIKEEPKNNIIKEKSLPTSSDNTKKSEIKKPNKAENKIESKLETKKEEEKKTEIKKPEEKIIGKKEEIKKENKTPEKPKEIPKKEQKITPEKEHIKIENEQKRVKEETKEKTEIKKIEKNKTYEVEKIYEENKDNKNKKDENKKPETNKNIIKKKEELKKPENNKAEEKNIDSQKYVVKKSVTLHEKSYIKGSESKPVTGTKPGEVISTKRQNFLALLSKFDKPKNEQPKKEPPKPLPKLIQKDNPFFQKLNQTAKTEDINKKKEEERKKKEEEKLKKEKLEKERLEKERLEKERLEQERLEKERIEKERIEKERLEQERLEQERLEKERLEQERLEQERLEKERQEQERLEKEREEKERLEQERLEQERLEQEKQKQEQERQEKERLEKERLENERLEKERLEKEKNIIESGNLNSDEEIIIKDSLYSDYIQRLYSIFIFWALSIDVSITFDAVSLKNCYINHLNGIEILFSLNKKLKNFQLIIMFLNSINTIISIPENAYKIFSNEKVYSAFLDLVFENNKLKGKNEETCFNLSKNIVLISFINSFEYCDKKDKTKYPAKFVNTLFLWGDKIIKENKNKKEEVFEFIFELLMEFMTNFKIKYESMIMMNSKKSYDVENNYYMKNYLFFMNCTFTFIFRFALDNYIYTKGEAPSNSSLKITIQNDIIKSMRINNTQSSKIGEIWIDFPLINDLMTKTKNIWSKKNLFKDIKLDKFAKNKPKKYEYIIENIITNKEKKNLYQRELEFLCYEDKSDKYKPLIPLIKLVPLTLISILSKLKDCYDDKDFKYWLKELKYFMRFLIIASTNLIKINQLELYNDIQNKSLEAISAGFCFLHSLFFSNIKCKNKIENYMTSLLLLCFKILKYQHNYKLSHKIVLNFASKPTRNNLQDSSVCKLFDLYIKDFQSNPYMNINVIDNLALDNNNYATKINQLIKSSDFIEAFFENNNLKNLLNDGLYSLSDYKKIVEHRYNSIKDLQDILDDSYKQTILLLLPQYENELAKYSNNSLEKSIKNKNRYKTFKKNAFSWRGFWSNRDNFYKDISGFKLKLINHYTKNFMKPILKPIIDVSYYLPEFSGFNPKDLFLNDEEDNKIFKLNMDLDKVLKITDQEKIVIYNTPTKNNEIKENYLVNIYKKSNPQLYEKLLKIANNLEFGKEEEFSFIEKDSSQEVKKKCFLSCLVKTSHHIKGVVFIDEKKLKFKVFLNQKTGNAMSGVEKGFTTDDDDYDQERKTCFGSFFVCHPKDKDLYKITINYKDIKWIFKRKYYYNNSALEIFTTTNKTFYFNFKYEKNREEVLKEILNKLDEPIQIIDDLKESKSQNIIGYENGIIRKKKGIKMKSFNLSKLVKSWKNWEISNFDFLMWLNILGNRSYNDISQYPIFPWILINYEDPLQVEQKVIISEKEQLRTISMALPEIQSTITYEMLPSCKVGSKDEEKTIIDYLYRNMSLPMGMLDISDESIKRKEEFEVNYETLLEDVDENNKPYIFGSNYSNPIYVCNFLMRLFPFTHISIELQGKGFDKADRLFNSVKTAFYNSTTQKGDVRELIPEFFYLPEMFRNINKLNMGKLDNGEQVGDILTPCNNNPYDFIMTMRSCLENNKISADIQNWIDLIFGYKARGKEAEKAKNIFKEASYQELIDINKIENKESQLREVEFGLIPNQLMIKECPKKDKKEVVRKGKEITDPECDLNLYECKLMNENDRVKEIEGLSVSKFACFSQDKISILLGGSLFLERKISYSIINKSYTDEQISAKVVNNYINRMSHFYNPERGDSKVMQFCHKGKTLIFGGFYDGNILIRSIAQDQKENITVFIPFIDKSPVIMVAVDKEDEFAFFGNEIGNIRILKLNKDLKESKLDLLITDHLSAISDINCSNELNLWVSASVDGYINLYTLPLSKLVRSLKVDTQYCDYVFLCASPLPCIVAIGEENQISEIFVYSINGELYIRQKEHGILKSPVIAKDLNSNEYLVYIIDDSIIIRALPTLIRQSSIDEVKNVCAICPSEDMRLIYAINKSGSCIKVIKDQI